MNKLSRATISIIGGDPKQNTFEESEESIFTTGSEVEISLELLRRFLSGLGEAEVVVIVDELFEEVEVVEKYVGNEGKSSVAATAAAG